MQTALLALAFGLAAAIYSMAGFGGGSAYLAILALAAVPTRQASVIALICNVLVVARTCQVAIRQRQFNWLELLAFATLSVPSAWLGASFPVKDRYLDLLLASALLLSALALISPKRAVEPGDVRQRLPAQRWRLGAAIGMPLGLIGGAVGIGGGVFLSPILHHLRWNTSRRIATLCSGFICVNSVAGLIGKRALLGTVLQFHDWWALPVAVVLGGTLGSRLLLLRLSNRWITRTTALIVLAASLQTFWRVWKTY